VGSSSKGGAGRLLGVVALLLGAYLLVAGVFTGGPDVVGGIVFGSVFLLAGVVILWRRKRE